MGKCVGIVGVDPGTTTGLAAAVFDVSLGSVRDACRGAALYRTSQVVSRGDSYRAEKQAVLEVMDFVFSFGEAMGTELGVWGPELICIEDFLLRGGRNSSVRSGLSPVRMTRHLEVELDHSPIVGADVKFYTPANAKGVVTDERLKLWGLKGGGVSDHAADACRQMVMGLKDELSREELIRKNANKKGKL